MKNYAYSLTTHALVLILFMLLLPATGLQHLHAQSSLAALATQTVRGQIVDLDTQTPLIGVNVVIPDSSPLLGSSTDEHGNFVIQGVPLGRASFRITYIGYEPLMLSDVLVTAGKELVLNLEMTESVIETEGVVVVAEELNGVALNEMATVSAQSFSVEQTQRYAASISDPARMAQTFAGVSGGGDDLLNEIVVRGNSPKGLLWQLEGIEIPNPNHFGEEGASGGGVSMLSSSTMGQSDFFTGAFPAAYGNAISGVFDLHLRNGNANRAEYALQLGVLGLDAAIEGPLPARGSFLVNYRYSTLGILNTINVLPDESIQYQDLSFKVNLATRRGNRFTLFGLGGDAQDVYGKAVPDSTQWLTFDDRFDGKFIPQMGVVGASYLWLVSPQTYLKTIVAVMGERRQDNEIMLIPSEGYAGRTIFEQDTRNWAYRSALQLNHKFSAKHVLQAGLNYDYLGYSLQTRDRDQINGPLQTLLDQKGHTFLIKGHLQLKLRPVAALTLTPGVHFTHFDLNNNQRIEPRVGMNWQVSEKSAVTAGIGLHSRTEPLALYKANRTREDGTTYTPFSSLDLMKAWHYVLGFNHNFSDKLRFKAELYYQRLLNIPVSTDVNRPFFAAINTESVWDVIFADDLLTNKGTGKNYGLELTLERFLGNGYYYMLTSSLYDARYTPLDGNSYHSRYAGNIVANAVAGKEFTLRNRNIFGVNARFIFAGGNRYIPLDVNRSIEENEHVFDLRQSFAKQVDPYYRLDFGVSYTINKAGATHAIRLDLQNLTNRLNVQGFVYDQDFQQLPYFHTGLIPILSYKVTF